MTAKHGATEDHTSAAFHHKRAAQFHREASMHYQTGENDVHAAFQALIAHGHALQAIERGNEVRKYYAEHNGNASSNSPQPIVRFPMKSLEATATMRPGRDGAEHHAAAADHHEQAARHHGQAAKHHEQKDDVRAAHEAQIADDHAKRSIFHGDEAAKHHAEHYGKSGPTAEIL